MSSSTSSRRRRRSPLRSPAAPAPGAPAEQQVAAAADDELVSRLRALLPREAAINGKAKAASRGRVLREACVYIRRLHAEVDAAAERLARLLEVEDDHPSSSSMALTTRAADGDDR